MKDETKIAIILAALLLLAGAGAWASTWVHIPPAAGQWVFFNILGPAFMVLWFVLMVDGIAFTLRLRPAAPAPPAHIPSDWEAELAAMLEEDRRTDARLAALDRPHLVAGGELTEKQDEDKKLYFELEI
jgi:hypothetical protein